MTPERNKELVDLVNRITDASRYLEFTHIRVPQELIPECLDEIDTLRRRVEELEHTVQEMTKDYRTVAEQLTVAKEALRKYAVKDFGVEVDIGEIAREALARIEGK